MDGRGGHVKGFPGTPPVRSTEYGGRRTTRTMFAGRIKAAKQSHLANPTPYVWESRDGDERNLDSAG